MVFNLQLESVSAIYMFGTFLNLGEFRTYFEAIWQEATRRKMATKMSPLPLNLLESQHCGMTAGMQKHHTDRAKVTHKTKCKSAAELFFEL